MTRLYIQQIIYFWSTHLNIYISNYKRNINRAYDIVFGQDIAFLHFFQEGQLISRYPGPLTPRFQNFPATSILPITFLCVFCVVYRVEPQCKTIHGLKEFIK